MLQLESEALIIPMQAAISMHSYTYVANACMQLALRARS